MKGNQAEATETNKVIPPYSLLGSGRNPVQILIEIPVYSLMVLALLLCWVVGYFTQKCSCEKVWHDYPNEIDSHRRDCIKSSWEESRRENNRKILQSLKEMTFGYKEEK